MFNKLLNFLFKPQPEKSAPDEDPANPSKQEKCKLTFFWFIKIDLENPSPKTLALVRLFMLMVMVIALAFVFKGNTIKDIPVVKKGDSAVLKAASQVKIL